MELEEISAHFQKSFEDGTKFPRIFSPYKNSRKDLEFLLNAVSKYRELLDSIIAKCGAIVFRGFEVHTGEDFNSVVQAFGWENYDYTKEGGTSTRTHVFGNVFTVNEDVPLEEDIGFHNECCYLPKVPTRLFFFCETAPAPGKGGSTSLVLGHTVYQKLLVENKSLVDELAEKNWIPLDKRVSPEFISFREDRAGRMVWFNHIRFGKRLQFADGTAISEEDYAKIMKVLEDEKVNVPWQKGDIVLLDNYAVLHGREGCRSTRRILISLTK